MIPTITYRAQKQPLIEAHIRKTASTVYHPTGTARIGDARDPMSVVDSELRVRKVTGLRIADVSVFPKVNRGHTMVPGIVVGEKCAESILRDSMPEPSLKSEASESRLYAQVL